MATPADEKQMAEMKTRMETMWEAAAAGYATWVIDNHLVSGLYPEFESFLAPQLRGKEGVRILDVASASGEPAATLATALPSAHVVSTDLAQAYLELGKARAAKLGLANVAFETADAEDLHRYGDACFDAVACSLGVMFMPNHRQALREFARVLKPGGSLAMSVWQAEDEVPFFKVAKELATEYDPDAMAGAAPSLAVRFGEPGVLLQDMAAAGLADVQCRALQVDFNMPARMWWREMLEMPLPIKPAITKAQQARPGEDLFEEARGKLRQRLVAHGWLDEEEALSIRGNGCWFITACKQE